MLQIDEFNKKWMKSGFHQIPRYIVGNYGTFMDSNYISKRKVDLGKRFSSDPLLRG